MKQKITGYRTDDENHWVADLDCGHSQHVRHDPPFFPREWVTTEEGRRSRLGSELDCKKCEDLKNECENTLRAAYEQAGQLGLCEEGRFEAALSALEQLQSFSGKDRQ